MAPMGSSSRQITVTCDCGREMRVARNLMGTHVKCPVCGAAVLLPADPAAGVGPPCPHCGRPWPVSEARCPSCMARTRTRRRRQDDGTGEGGLSRHFAPIAADPSAPGPAYERPPPMDPATVRVKNWYDKPTTLGWPIATGLTALAGFSALLGGLGGDGLWIVLGTALLLAALGLRTGAASARSFILSAPMLIVVVGSALAVWMAPDQLSWPEAAVLTVIVGAMTAGFALLTSRHGTVGVVGLGAFLALFGILATCIAMSTTGWHNTVTGRVAADVRGGLSDMGKTLSATRPAPASDVDVDFAAARPPEPPPPVVPPRPRPVQPEAAPLPTQPATQPATAPAPAPVPVDWTAAMADAGFQVAFARPDRVRALRGPVTIEDIGPCVQTKIEWDSVVLETAAVILDEAAPQADQAELVAAARHVAATIGGEIDYQMWRNDRGPRVYLVRTRIDRDGRDWISRIESRRVEDRVVVLVGVHQQGHRAAESGSWRFFRSLRLGGDEED